MKPKIKDIEIMAPVGSFESLSAAIQAGANSVYFGIEQLNMRAKSSNNFTIEDLKTIVKICRENNLKSYLTVNTIIYDKEISLMKKIVDAAKECDVSAIIASDQSVIHYAFSKAVEVHISTQLNISNIETVKFYSMFADVMVLARELNLSQVLEITEAIQNEQIKGPSGKLIEIEIFIHGALCMAVSGKCYLSLHEQNYSANRGNCLQTCRKAYLVSEKESGYELEVDNEYIMSPKDLSTISFIDRILDAGVTVLKIEGRARPPEYVKKVVECYREAIESYFDATLSKEKIKNWEEKLSSVFNRGFWDGYYLGRKMGEWSKLYGSRATKKKMYLAKGTNYFSNIKVAEFLLEAGSLQIGDEVLIIGPTTGVIETTIKEIRVDEKPVEIAKKGESFSIQLDEIVRRSDKLYKLIEAKKIL
ncbi:MAG: U32 family peptidase [Bacteroidetes bacterium]|jgi:U32 family peptidase|nr:U32 family peptidase [Bacteroidota bacterium]MBT6687363.1 U32 family peptidase [Bacteroidota bacterium]MBT7143914.1 U32 family peptidase [Bacteroidota bacterium]MBT7492418.1 U32 family peptidase [Bacteroidota bacterium]